MIQGLIAAAVRGIAQAATKAIVKGIVKAIAKGVVDAYNPCRGARAGAYRLPWNEPPDPLAADVG